MEATLAATPSSGHIVYVVQVGDTLGEIASAYGTTVQAISQLNSLDNPSRIFPGQELKIPAAAGSAGPTSIAPSNTPNPTPTSIPTTIPITYAVQVGDTISSIAGLYGISAVELAQLNGISVSGQLTVGQILTIPG